jgi:ribonuclease HI
MSRHPQPSRPPLLLGQPAFNQRTGQVVVASRPAPGALVAATDGACAGNPGPGGWAWFVNETMWAAGGSTDTTNNVMELQALRELLHATAGDSRAVHVILDSKYVLNCVTVWIHNWRRRGWTSSKGEPVANRTLIEQIDELRTGRQVTFEWVRGHAGHPLNSRADAKAACARDNARRGRTPLLGPGLPR